MLFRLWYYIQIEFKGFFICYVEYLIFWFIMKSGEISILTIFFTILSMKIVHCSILCLICTGRYFLRSIQLYFVKMEKFWKLFFMSIYWNMSGMVSFSLQSSDTINSKDTVIGCKKSSNFLKIYVKLQLDSMDLGLSNSVSDASIRFLIMILDIYIPLVWNAQCINTPPLSAQMSARYTKAPCFLNLE